MLFFINISRYTNSTPSLSPARKQRPPKACPQLHTEGKHAKIGALVDACQPKDEAGNLIASQEKLDLLPDLLAFLVERVLEMDPAEANGGQGLPGELPGGQGGGPHAQDRSSQGYCEHDYESFLAVLKKNCKKLAVDPLCTLSGIASIQFFQPKPFLPASANQPPCTIIRRKPTSLKSQ